MLPTLCACAKLRRAARIVSKLYDEALAPSGLTVTQFSLLRMLQRTGPTSLTAFAEASGYDRTSLNRLLKPLESAGFVQSTGCSDQRSRIVGLTERAKQPMLEAQPHWEEAQRRIEEKLGGEGAALFAILDRIEELRA